MKNNQKFFIQLFATSFLGLAGCGVYESKVHPRPLNEINSLLNQKSKISFSQVNEAIIKPNCTRCHQVGKAGGGVLLDTYENVLANLDDIHYVTAVEKSMPQDTGPLPAEKITILQRWIEEGAPNEVTGSHPDLTPTPAPTPTPTPIPAPTPAPIPAPSPEVPPLPMPSATPILTATPVLTATYASIRDQIFAVKCLKCHAAGGTQSDLPLDDYSKMMAQGELIVPGNPESSTVVQQIEKGKMPSPRSGIPQVTAEELAAIKIWITNGAKP